MAWVPSSRSSWSKAPPFPSLPALLFTHDFKAQGHIHFADGNTRPRKGRKLPEVTQPGGSRALPLSLLLALSYSAPSAGASPYTGCPRQVVPLLGAAWPPPRRNLIHTPTLKPALGPRGLGIKQHSLQVPKLLCTARFQVSETVCKTLPSCTHPIILQACGGP